MRSIFSKIALTVSFLLAITFTLSCGDHSLDDLLGNNSSSSVSERSFSYCITASGICLPGSYTVAECNGTVSNSCPSNPNGSSPSVGNSSSSGGVTPNYSLDGVWVSETRGTTTFSGSIGVLSSFESPISAVTQDAINKGYFTLGMQTYRNLISTGTLKWSGQRWSTYSNDKNPNVAIGANWFNCTITMSTDGQTITIVVGGTTSSDGTIINGVTFTMTRKQ